MPKSLEVSASKKIRLLQDVAEVLEKERRKGLKIVQCHGVFDLLHPGHIRHFREAKAQGDKLVVSVTPDRFVNKGPGRPAFNEQLRLESLAALADVDYVVLNDSPDAISAIQKIRPNLYVKGKEYADHAADVTGKISQEVNAVESAGGRVYYTDDVVFSSSSLLNKYFDSMPKEVVEFLGEFKKKHSSDEILEKIELLSDLKVLVIGDAIIDEYQYTEPMGQSGKGLHMVARCLDKEVFLGGSLIIANHLAQFAKEVTLVTALGRDCPYLSFITHHLDPRVQPRFTSLEDSTTLVKKRYVLKDGKNLTKLFETYSGQEEPLHPKQTLEIVEFLKQSAAGYDLVLACDFGNGFTNQPIIEAISDVPTFLALNTQMNSGNRGFNVVTNYRRADYISLNEPELRLSMHDKTSSLDGLAVDVCQLLNVSHLSITRGVNGVQCYSSSGDRVRIPAFATNTVDRIGAGDSFLSLSSLAMAKGYPSMMSGFLGSLAAAMSVQVVGNQEAVKKAQLCKFLIRMLK
ncbi:MAG: cytidyltransferase-related domain [Parachlamydiales bacterium]|nr:cytidyltransferase-related domain [Parachlamydiales bacterium]